MTGNLRKHRRRCNTASRPFRVRCWWTATRESSSPPTGARWETDLPARWTQPWRQRRRNDFAGRASRTKLIFERLVPLQFSRRGARTSHPRIIWPLRSFWPKTSALQAIANEESGGEFVLGGAGGGRGRGLCDAGGASRGEAQFRLHSGRGVVLLRHRLPVLFQVDRGAGAGAERPPRDAVRSPRRWQGLCEDEQMDRLRPSFRGDFRAGTAARAGARGAVRLPTRNLVDIDRGGAGRRGAGFGGV